jgi:hypothetical protein
LLKSRGPFFLAHYNTQEEKSIVDEQTKIPVDGVSVNTRKRWADKVNATLDRVNVTE